jgi:hypothetical protein
LPIGRVNVELKGKSRAGSREAFVSAGENREMRSSSELCFTKELAMFTTITRSLMIAALGLAAGLTLTAQAAPQSRAVVQCYPYPMPPLGRMVPGPVLPVIPIQPSLTPSLPICPAPQPVPVQPAPRAARQVAVTGDDDGCTGTHGQKPTHPVPPRHGSEAELV